MGIRTRGRWVRTANATSVLCDPPLNRTDERVFKRREEDDGSEKKKLLQVKTTSCDFLLRPRRTLSNIQIKRGRLKTLFRRERERERGRERACVCVCVQVSVRARWRERERERVCVRASQCVRERERE